MAMQITARTSDRCGEVVLGIDPGLNRTGYAILSRTAAGPKLVEAGIIRSQAERSLAERVLEIGSGLREVIEQYPPDVMAIEQVFTTIKFPKSSILMAHARGALLFAAADRGIHVEHYTAAHIKRMLTGSGRAPKAQMQQAVASEQRLRSAHEPHDVADACAVALCQCYTQRRAA